MYLILCVLAPVVFIWQERMYGGRLPVSVPFPRLAYALAIYGAVVCGVTGIALLHDVPSVDKIWPWKLTPLVGSIIGVWFTTLAAAYCWALRDGDLLRTQPMFWQAIPTGIGLALIPLLHSGDMRDGADMNLAIYVAAAFIPAIGSIIHVLMRRPAPVVGPIHAGP